MFADRNEPARDGGPGLQDALSDALDEIGAQILVYGEVGVGKTSLLRHVCAAASIHPVVVQCLPSLTFGEHIEMALAEVVDRREVEVESDHTDEVGGGASLLTIKGSVKKSTGERVRFESIRKPPLLALVDAVSQAGRFVVVFDNFQNVRSTEHEAFAHALETLADRSIEDSMKFILVGAAEDAPNLLGRSTSLRRRIVEVGVPRMEDAQISRIFTRGFALLDLSIDRRVRDHLVFLSDGFPFFAHMLGLTAARAARRAGAGAVTPAIAARAAQSVARQAESSYEAELGRASDSYRAMAKLPGVAKSLRPRSRILHYLAESPRRRWSHAEIIRECRQRSPVMAAAPTAVIRQAIHDLASPPGGNVLVQGRQHSPNPFYRFRDPYLRTYLRLGTFGPRFGMTRVRWKRSPFDLELDTSDEANRRALDDTNPRTSDEPEAHAGRENTSTVRRRRRGGRGRRHGRSVGGTDNDPGSVAQ